MPYFYYCRAMVTLYSAEAYEEAKLALISRLLADIDTVESAAERAGEVLPVSGGWAELAKYLRQESDKKSFKLRKAPPTECGPLATAPGGCCCVASLPRREA